MLGGGRKGSVALWIPILCGLLAVVARLPVVPDEEAAAAWTRGAEALQGLRVSMDPGEMRRDLTVTFPLSIAQNAGYAIHRIVDSEEAGSRVAWIRGHDRFSAGVLRILWILAAAGAAALASRRLPGGWGFLAGAGVALVPIGIVASIRLEPWGLAGFLLIAALSARRIVLAGLAWGAVVSLTPLGWIAAIVRLGLGDRRSRLALLLAVPVWLALDPARLVAPIAAVKAIGPGISIGGWPGVGAGSSGRLLVASWTPGLGAVFLGLLGALASLRSREGRSESGIFLVLWLLPALAGAVRPDAIGLAAPVVVVLAARGVEAVAVRARRARWLLGSAAAAVLLAPLAVSSFQVVEGRETRRDRQRQLARLLDEAIGAGDLLARDPRAPAPPDSIPAFAFPTHVTAPEVWDFAYWPGWYGPFTHMLFRASTLQELEERSRKYPGARAMTFGLVRHARAVGVLGDPADDPAALVLYRLEPGPPWEPTDRHARWAEIRGGAFEAQFLDDLAAFLLSRGEVPRAVELLRLALAWDDESPLLWINLGSALMAQGEPLEAAKVLTQGLERNPDSVDLHYALGLAYLEGGIPERASIELRTVLSRRPNFARAHYDLARVAMEMEQWGLAARALEAYLANEPNPANRAEIEQALAEARRLAESAP